MVQRKLDELKRECKKLNLEVIQTGKREAKKDFVLALSNHFYQTDSRKGQYGFEFMRSIDSPMLCQRIQYLKEHEQAEVMKDGNHWVFEEKLDGARIVITYHPEQGFDFYSRNISVSNYLPISYKDTVWLGDRDWKGVFKVPFVIDCEIISKDKNISTVLGKRGVEIENQLQATTALMAMDPERSIPIQRETGGFEFHIFDVLKLDTADAMNCDYRRRMSTLSKLVPILIERGFPAVAVESVVFGKEKFLNDIIARGGEGVVAKNIHSLYTATESRGRDRWIKIKRAQTNAHGDNIDAFITGYLPGNKGSDWENLVGSLEVSVFIQRSDNSEFQHMIARVTNITLEERKKMTDYKDGKPILRPEYYGKVVEITGQDVSSRAKRLTHSAIVKWRPDRDYLSCKLSEKVLNEGIL